MYSFSDFAVRWALGKYLLFFTTYDYSGFLRDWSGKWSESDHESWGTLPGSDVEKLKSYRLYSNNIDRSFWMSYRIAITFYYTSLILI